MDYEERERLREMEGRHRELLDSQDRQEKILQEQTRQAERERREKRDAERREKERQNKIRMKEGLTSISKAISLQPSLIVNLLQILLPDAISEIDSIMEEGYKSKGESTIDQKILPIINVLPESEREKLITKLKTTKETAIQNWKNWQKERAEQESIDKKKREEREKDKAEYERINKKMTLLVWIRRVSYVTAFGSASWAGQSRIPPALPVLLFLLSIPIALMTAVINQWWYWPKHHKLWEKIEMGE